MSKGISDAQKAKERLWTDADFKSGKIKSIQYRDSDYNYCCSPGDSKSTKTIPVYGEIEIDFDDHVTCRVPCTLAEAKEYSIGDSASINLVVNDGDDDD